MRCRASIPLSNIKVFHTSIQGGAFTLQFIITHRGVPFYKSDSHDITDKIEESDYIHKQHNHIKPILSQPPHSPNHYPNQTTILTEPLSQSSLHHLNRTTIPTLSIQNIFLLTYFHNNPHSTRHHISNREFHQR